MLLDLIRHNLAKDCIPLSVQEAAEIDIKYSGYLSRQKSQIDQFKKQRKMLLPKNINYQSINTISQEARETLTKAQPNNLGHAAELPGVSKADLTALLVWLKLHIEQKKKPINVDNIKSQ